MVEEVEKVEEVELSAMLRDVDRKNRFPGYPARQGRAVEFPLDLLPQQSVINQGHVRLDAGGGQFELGFLVVQ